jgi:invasion protein IalB
VEGVLILPFGLAVDKPVALQIDEGPTQTGRFSTCLPAGCLVPVAFDPSTVASLKKGTTLKVKAIAVNGQNTAFTISLKGFASAIDRTAALVK